VCSRNHFLLVSTLLLLVAACDDHELPASDATVADANVAIDASIDDANRPPLDAGLADGSPDATLVDGGPADAALPDAAPSDAALLDASLDAALPDAASVDASVPDATPPADAREPPQLGGFVIGRASAGENRWIVRIPLDGGPAINLSPPRGMSTTWFKLSADGQTVVYSAIPVPANPANHRHLYAVPVDGSSPPRELAGAPLTEPISSGFDFSPDGSRIAYLTNEPGGVSRLFTVRVDGSDRVAVSGNRRSATWRWSPDGERLVYNHPRELQPDETLITCADRDCSHSPLPGQLFKQFSFSSDGKHLAVQLSTSQPDVYELRVIDFPREAVHLISTQTTAWSDSLHWSPDSRRLAFFEKNHPDDSLHVACPDGTCNVQMPLPFTFKVQATDNLAWSPDSQFLYAVAQLPNGSPDHVFTICADGSCLHEHDSAGDSWAGGAVWAPDGHLVLRGRLPGTADAVLVADCGDASCARVSASGSVKAASLAMWAGTSSRFAFLASNSIWVNDGFGQEPVQVWQGLSATMLGFDASGQRFIYFAEGSVRMVGIDGTGSRSLEEQLSPRGLLSASLIVR